MISHTRILLLLVTSLFAFFGIAGASQLLPFEPNPEFAASQILPPDLLRSEFHEVQEPVSNDGFLNHYIVETPYGNLGAEGRRQLQRVIHEARALAELDRVSQTEIFLDAAKRTVTQPVEAIDKIIDEPADTVRGIPGGLSRKFHSLSRKASGGIEQAKQLTGEGDHDDWEEKGKEGATAYALKWFGMTDAERRWAQKLDCRVLPCALGHQ